MWSSCTTSDTVLDSGPGTRDVLHLHNDSSVGWVIGCEETRIRYASRPTS